MLTFITVIHVVTCTLLVLVILLQSGKGAEISASFSGSSQTVFGSSGGANFFTRFTQVAAAIFFTTSLVLTVIGNKAHQSRFDTTGVPASAVPAAGVPVPTPTKMVPVGAAKAPAAPEQGQATSGNAPAAPAPVPTAPAAH